MILAINTKTHQSYKEALKYTKQIKNMNVIIIPSNCYLSIFQNGKYKLGSQDISEYVDTEKTGEMTCEQLKSLNVKYSLVGHYERRTYKNETNEILIEKLNNLLENNITPIYCIDEINYKDELDLLKEITIDKEIIIAYEPTINIGSECPNLKDLETILLNIKKQLVEMQFNKSKIIYGGGVNVNNIEYFKSLNNLDGLLISKNGLDIKVLKKIYKKIKF